VHPHNPTSPNVNMHASSLLAIMLGLAASSTTLSTQDANRRLRRDPPPTTPTVVETIPPATAPIPSVSTGGSLIQNPRLSIQLPNWSASHSSPPLGAQPPPQTTRLTLTQVPPSTSPTKTPQPSPPQPTIGSPTGAPPTPASSSASSPAAPP